jgi:hypothetical protein
MSTSSQLTIQDVRSECHLDQQMTLCYSVNRTICSSIFHRLSNKFSAPFTTYFPSSCFTHLLLILRSFWSLTTFRRAISRMTSHFVKRYTQLDLKNSQAHSLASNDVSSVSDNPSPSRNTQASLNTHDDIAVKSKRNRAYLNKEDDERIASSANRKRLTSTRSDVEHNTERAKSSSSSSLHSFSQSASVDETSRKDDATDKLNGKRSFKIKKESP